MDTVRAGVRSSRMGRSALLMAATLVCTPASLELLQDNSYNLVGVVGHWSDTTAGAPAVVVNGEAWTGESAREDVQSVSHRLFGSATDTFMTNMTVPTAFPIAIAPAVDSFRNGTLRVQFNMIGGKSDQNAGLLFGLRPSGEYYYVRYNTKDGNVALWSYANGERKVILHGEVHKQIPLGTWHELVVELRGREVRGWIAGDTTISVHHTLDADPAGRVGVWVKRDAITAFRAFRAVP